MGFAERQPNILKGRDSVKGKAILMGRTKGIAP